MANREKGEKVKTQSFTINRPASKNPQNSQVSLSPDKSEKRSAHGGNEYANANVRRFRRMNLDSDFNPRTYITNEISLEDVMDLK
jgi:hypothetical protein